MKQGIGIRAVSLLLTILLPPVTACSSEEPKGRAYVILRDGVTAQGGRTRTKAIRALANLSADTEARAWAEKALVDKNADVRGAAAGVLAQIGNASSIPFLMAALKDPEPRVVLATAQALYALGDPSAFAVFRNVLSGKQKAIDGFVKTQMRTMEDPKVLTWMSIEQGAGFVPYAGNAVWLVETLLKNPASSFRADAARKLSKDPGPDSTEALAQGTCDKNWQVRAASAAAIGERNDPALLDTVIALLADRNDTVRFNAAAVVWHLSDRRASRE